MINTVGCKLLPQRICVPYRAGSTHRVWWKIKYTTTFCDTDKKKLILQFHMVQVFRHSWWCWSWGEAQASLSFAQVCKNLLDLVTSDSWPHSKDDCNFRYKLERVLHHNTWIVQASLYTRICTCASLHV